MSLIPLTDGEIYIYIYMSHFLFIIIEIRANRYDGSARKENIAECIRIDFRIGECCLQCFCSHSTANLMKSIAHFYSGA